MFASDLLITPASEMTSWQNLFVAVVPVLGLIAVAYLQFVHKAGKKRGEEAQEANAIFMAQWETNKQDHDFVVSLIDNMGKSLGHSIDRVETNMQSHFDRIENKIETHDTVLFEHLATHAEVKFNEESRPNKRQRDKQ